jgi:ELWxxDGT repeat protein
VVVAPSATWFLCAVALSLSLMMQVTETYSQSVLIKDVYEQTDLYTNEYGSLIPANGFFYFTSNKELWKSNGTRSGSIKLKTFRNNPANLKMCGSTLYFSADDGSGTELWKSNGTTSSTVRVKDIYPGTSASNPQSLTDVNGILYFTAISPGFGREVWKSNGTAAGTVLVKDVFPKGGSSNPAWLVNLNGILVFSANDGTRGYELWRTNGTAEGTVFLKDIRTGTRLSSSPEHLTVAGNRIFFVANDGVSGRELWKTDGTSVGTVLVKDIWPGSKTPLIENITAVNSSVFFSANDGTYGHELWKSNGTAASTVMVKDLTPGPAGSHAEEQYLSERRMGSFKNINGTLFFTAFQGPTYYTWKSDGTAAGTIPLQEASGPGYLQPNAMFTYMNGSVFYFNSPTDKEDVYYLNRMNIDGSNPEIIAEFAMFDYYSPYYPKIMMSGNRLYVVARPQVYAGFSLFACDGTKESFSELLDTYVGTISSSPSDMVTFKGKVYFQTNVNDWDYPYIDFLPREVWRTDGTAAGTELLFRGSDLRTLISKDQLFIRAWCDTGDCFKVVDAAGVVTDIPSSSFGGVRRMVDANGTVFFENYRRELWKTNGTAAGTIKVHPGPNIRSINAIGSTVIFHTVTNNTEELWKSNGTVSGTVKIKTIRQTSGYGNDSYPSVVHNGVMYFIANDGVHGNEVWRTNGTAAGTYMLYDINGNDVIESYSENDINYLHIFQGQLFISARQVTYSSPGVIATDKWELRQGLDSGTTAVVGEIDPVIVMTSDANTLYLLTAEFWKSRYKLLAYKPGRALPLQEVKDFGTDHMFIFGFDSQFVNGELYFSGGNRDLWRSGGSPCNTIKIPTGSDYGNPIELLGSNLIIGAKTGIFGIEPHRFPLSAAPASPECVDALAEPTIAQTESVTITSHPNPFTEHFKIRVNTAAEESLHIAVYTMDGYPVEEIPALSTATDYEIGKQWRQGWHVIRATTKSGVYTTKVFKK